MAAIILPMNNRFKLLGILLTTSGIIYSPVAYLVLNSTPLSAIGLSAVVIGLVCLSLAGADRPLSTEYCRLMLITGYVNTTALIEEIGATGRAVYIPSTLAIGKPRTIVPLIETNAVVDFQDRIPNRLIVRYGSNPEDMAISVLSPGSSAIDQLESRPGPTEIGITSALTYLLVGLFDVAQAVNVTLNSTRVEVNIVGIDPATYMELPTCSFGSPLASVAAAVTAEGLGKCIRILEERLTDSTLNVKLAVPS